jgi:hypothetical protein
MIKTSPQPIAFIKFAENLLTEPYWYGPKILISAQPRQDKLPEVLRIWRNRRELYQQKTN